MTTPYIDPNLIFAENAPVQDKPAAFQNYDKGWDESRKNDGRPLIPQMNYLAQQADLKNLYIHENGAALPYKDGIAYEENAVVVKDGVSQQWKGGVWVDVVSDHTANSMQDLMQLNPSQTGSLVFVKSYHQGKGLGGGKYQYISTLLKSAHNGGTIIDPALAFPTDWDNQAQLEAWFYPTSQTGYGCWSRIGKG